MPRPSIGATWPRRGSRPAREREGSYETMLKLHVVQAREGDCMIVEHGTPAQPGYILVDGGPVGVYDQHLCAMLSDIQARVGGLDLAVVSHVDDDHIVGVLDLLNDLQQEHTHGAPETVHVT